MKDRGHFDPQRLDQVAMAVKERLQMADSSLVLAESCTGGLIAATLAAFPASRPILQAVSLFIRLPAKLHG
ncbi:MAG UNVERIFIED_CONTAM: CinA family protein [Planctomycetaceae bacterium]|jgi:nicotinamide mononucleotide (NMN) deamidase PncC